LRWDGTIQATLQEALFSESHLSTYSLDFKPSKLFSSVGYSYVRGVFTLCMRFCFFFWQMLSRYSLECEAFFSYSWQPAHPS